MLFWRVLFWLSVVGGLGLALWPHSQPADPWFSGADKLQHAVTFAALTLMGMRAGYRSFKLLALGLLALGASIEVAQALFTTTRSAEWLDWLADGVGVALGLAVCMALRAHSTKS